MKILRLTVLASVLLLSGGSFLELAGAQAPATRSAEILYQTDTYTPPFYRGKALPSSENLVTAVAYPDLSGTSLDPAKLHYKWMRDGEVIPGYVGTGKRLASFTTSIASDETLLEVEIADPAGSYRARRAMYLKDEEPKVVIYEDNAVLGVLYNRAVGKEFTLQGAEAAFLGVPFYFSADTSRDSRLRYVWSVGGKGSSGDERLIVRTDGESGASTIALEVSHESRYAQLGSYGFTIFFGNDR
ncbi:MAG TPA: hypothetical protein VD967_01490 [Candidatus Paceibacterota bacterium]|nr:hypothetical protein [Candidatus Paceibacterota bacterium]